VDISQCTEANRIFQFFADECESGKLTLAKHFFIANHVHPEQVNYVSQICMIA
jgi:hypothetical protein